MYVLKLNLYTSFNLKCQAFLLPNWVFNGVLAIQFVFLNNLKNLVIFLVFVSLNNNGF